MKIMTLLATVFCLVTQAQAARIVEGRLDADAKKAYLVLEIENACNQPQFELRSNYCNKRIDGPCYYQLEQTIQNRMFCQPKKTLVHRVVDVPETMLSPRLTIVVGFGESSFVLQQSDFWKR